MTFSDCFHFPSTAPGRYTPQLIDLDHKLKPFIPDFIPAVGDIDAFLKVQMVHPKKCVPWGWFQFLYSNRSSSFSNEHSLP
jgi:hypothetical protein